MWLAGSVRCFARRPLRSSPGVPESALPHRIGCGEAESELGAAATGPCERCSAAAAAAGVSREGGSKRRGGLKFGGVLPSDMLAERRKFGGESFADEAAANNPAHIGEA